MSEIILIPISIILNIPIAVIFNKVGIKGINAFIPFVNVLNYIRIVGFKKKYIVSLSIIIFCLILAWDSCGAFSSGYVQICNGILRWFGLLLLIPAFFACWLPFGMVSIISTFRSRTYGEWTLLMAFGSMFIFIYLILFYGKLAYKFALKFGWKPWAAMLYVFFQPIAVWVLAFGLWEYKGFPSKTQLNKNENVLQSVSGVQSGVNIVSNQTNKVSENGCGQENSLSNEIISQDIMQEKRNDRFFRNTILIIFALLVGFFFLRAIPRYMQSNAIGKERQEQINKNVEKLLRGELIGDTCNVPDYDSWHSYEKLKLPKYISGYGSSSYLFENEKDGVCYEAYNLQYDDKKEGFYVYYYEIADFKTKETLFKCVEHKENVLSNDSNLVLLEINGENLNSKDGCDKLFYSIIKTVKGTVD